MYCTYIYICVCVCSYIFGYVATHMYTACMYTYIHKHTLKYVLYNHVLDIDIHVRSIDLILTYAGILKLSFDYVMN